MTASVDTHSLRVTERDCTRQQPQAKPRATSSPGQFFFHRSDLTANIMRVGLNYRFAGPDAGAFAPDPAMGIAMPPLFLANWQVEAGARAWFNTGKVGAPQPLLNAPGDVLASRLVYAGLEGVAGETFARLDHSSGAFVKGFLGAGGIARGRVNDEDFPAESIAYSNTVSSTSGHLAYANIDFGYTFLQTQGAKVGAFVGYNHFAQHINSYGCAQIAGSDICAPGQIAPGFMALIQDNNFNSMRLGLSLEFMLTDRLRLTADAAYLPLVGFKGQDDHNSRELLIPQTSSSGDGAMFETILGGTISNGAL